MRIGIDTGGTFTDFVLFDPQIGRFDTFKLLSTPNDPSEAILEGLSKLRDTKAFTIIHGSTVATNALLERKGAQTALITTAGFRDVLQIGRQNRPSLYDLFADPPAPLVPPQHRLEVTERVNYLAEIQTAIDEKEIDALIAHCRKNKIESVAICLLFSFANNKHEKLIQEKFDQAGFFVSASHQISPEFREYERASTTVINAYVSPVMGKYLKSLEASLPESRVQVMQSNGGMISAGRGAREAVRCILSGPAGGVMGARAVAKATGFERVMTFDMGGTSTDVSLIDGDAQISTSGVIGGLPINIPMLAIHTVGSGGGSIAFRDRGGGLQVGPQSAGADPGPACYGRGDLPTVTDANLLLGRIRPEYFFGGQMRLHPQRAQEAFAKLAGELNLPTETCQLGVLRIVNAHMARALRVISVEKGKDPRDFSLLSFGGAGGLHAVELARELGMPRVIVPKDAATLSALGMLMADTAKDYSRTVMLPGATPFATLQQSINPLVEQGRLDLKSEGFLANQIEFELKADLRYAGQSFELSVPFREQLSLDFHQLHRAAYGYSDESVEVEIVNLRVRAIGRVEGLKLTKFPPALTNIDSTTLGHFDVLFDSGKVSTPFYDGSQLGPGHVFAGPAIVVHKDTTILVGQLDAARVDEYLSLIIEIGGGA